MKTKSLNELENYIVGKDKEFLKDILIKNAKLDIAIQTILKNRFPFLHALYKKNIKSENLILIS